MWQLSLLVQYRPVNVKTWVNLNWNKVLISFQTTYKLWAQVEFQYSPLSQTTVTRDGIFNFFSFMRYLFLTMKRRIPILRSESCSCAVNTRIIITYYNVFVYFNIARRQSWHAIYFIINFSFHNIKIIITSFIINNIWYKFYLDHFFGNVFRKDRDPRKQSKHDRIRQKLRRDLN